jgi:curved DNA-binding protein CbpA
VQNQIDPYQRREHFEIDEKTRTLEFENMENIRRKTFDDEMHSRRNMFEKEMNKIERQEKMAYQMFNLDQNFDLAELKKAYRKRARACHPDRGGEPEMFEWVTKCYMMLLEKYKRRQSDRQFTDLRDDSINFINEQQQQHQPPQKIAICSGENFDVQAFNKIYKDNRLLNPFDNGHGDWMKSYDYTQEKIPELFSQKFNLNVFNNTFDQMKDKDEACNQLISRSNPEALLTVLTEGYTELGQDAVNDFGNISSSGGLGYTDVKKAYTQTKLINTKAAVNAPVRSTTVEDYEREREQSMRIRMTQDEAKEYALLKAQEEDVERRRRLRLEAMDQNISNNHAKINQYFLER